MIRRSRLGPPLLWLAAVLVAVVGAADQSPAPKPIHQKTHQRRFSSRAQDWVFLVTARGDAAGSKVNAALQRAGIPAVIRTELRAYGTCVARKDRTRAVAVLRK